MTGVAPARLAARSHAAVLRSKRRANGSGSFLTDASTSGARAKITTARDMPGSLLECAAHAPPRHERDRAAEERAGASSRPRDRRHGPADDDAASLRRHPLRPG